MAIGTDNSTLTSLTGRAAAFDDPSTGLVDIDGSFLGWPDVHLQVSNLAGSLVELGIEPGDRICVAHPRSTASFIAVHAILHAGAVMVPLDPLGPPGALSDVVAAVEPAAIIGATQTLIQRLSAHIESAGQLVVHHGDSAPIVELGADPTRLVDFGRAVSTPSGVTLPVVQPDRKSVV